MSEGPEYQYIEFVVDQPWIGTSPLTVFVHGLLPWGEEEVLTWEWDFGDGSPPQGPSPYLQDAYHVYTSQGVYDITLTATSATNIYRGTLSSPHNVLCHDISQITQKHTYSKTSNNFNGAIDITTMCSYRGDLYLGTLPSSDDIARVFKSTDNGDTWTHFMGWDTSIFMINNWSNRIDGMAVLNDKMYVAIGAYIFEYDGSEDQWTPVAGQYLGNSTRPEKPTQCEGLFEHNGTLYWLGKGSSFSSEGGKTHSHSHIVYSSNDGSIWNNDLTIEGFDIYTEYDVKSICVFNNDVYVACKSEIYEEDVDDGFIELDPEYFDEWGSVEVTTIWKRVSAGNWELNAVLPKIVHPYRIVEFKEDLYCVGGSNFEDFDWRLEYWQIYKYDGSNWNEGPRKLTYNTDFMPSVSTGITPAVFVSADGYLMIGGPDKMHGRDDVSNKALVYYSSDGANFDLEEYATIQVTEGHKIFGDISITSGGRTLIGSVFARTDNSLDESGQPLPMPYVYYFDSDSEPEPELTADFTSDKTIGYYTPVTVNFTDASTGSPTSWEWDFGDGSEHSSDQNPEHIYAEPGVYTVTLTIQRGEESDSETKVKYITAVGKRQIHKYFTTKKGLDNEGDNKTVSSIRRFCHYKGKLYAGVTGWYNTNQGEVRKSEDDGLTWEFVYHLGNMSSSYVTGMVVFNNEMYVSISSTSTPYLWKYDGEDWSTIAGAPPIHGDLFSDNNKIYQIGSRSSGGTWYPVYSSSDGSTWSPDLTASQHCVGDVICKFNNNIFVGCTMGTGIDGRIYKKSGDSWDAGTSLPNAGGFYGMVEFKGALYCLASDTTSNANWLLFKYDGSNWSDPIKRDKYSTNMNSSILFVSSDNLLIVAGPQIDSGLYLYYSDNGEDFYAIEQYTPYSVGTYPHSVVPNSSIVSNNRTLIGASKEAASQTHIHYFNAEPTADFSADITLGDVDLTVQFQNESVGNTITSYDWDFGDGAPHSSETDPIHTYTKPGVYDVTLTATNAFGPGSITKERFISAIGTKRLHTFLTTSGLGVPGITRFCDYNGKLYCGSKYGSGNLPTVFVSTDGGLNWTLSRTITESGNNSVDGMVVFNNKMYVAVNSEIWEYDDTVNPATWTRVAATYLGGATGNPTDGYDLIVHNDVLYWIGRSSSYPGDFKDAPVYSSTDGSTWVADAVLTGGYYSGYRGRIACIFNDEIYVYCYSYSNDNARLIKKNKNDGNWSQVSNFSQQSIYGQDLQYTRDPHGMVVFKGNLYCLCTGHATANYWFLFKYDGNEISETVIGRYCQANPSLFVSVDQYLMVSGPDRVVDGGSIPQVYYSTNGNDFCLQEDYYSTPIVHRFESKSSIVRIGIGGENRTLVGGTGSNDSPIFYFGIGLAADFEADLTSGGIPFEVNFTDLSKGDPGSHKWDFGDGSDFSYDQNPTHIYTKSGVYDVTLTVVGEAGIEDLKTRTNYITVTPTAAFSTDVTSGSVPLKVQFTDESIGEDLAYYWNFGDTTYSIEQNPEHIYEESGRYNVTLTVTDQDSFLTNSITKIDHITVTPKAAFLADKTSGRASLTVQFTNQSTGSPTSYLWNFGDGSPDSLDPSPEHTYTEPGVYNVTLTSTNEFGSDIKTDYITVTPTAAFSAGPIKGKAPLAISFTNESINGAGGEMSWEWDFGDGSAHSNEQNPTHTYESVGAYTVTLTATSTINGSDSEIKDNYILILGSPIADFVGDPDSGYNPLTVNFTSLSEGNPVQDHILMWNWNFGDPDSGIFNTSTDPDPSHTFNSPGKYSITLSVTSEGGTSTLTKTNYIESKAATADFIGTPLAGASPLTVQFSDNSVFPATTFVWDFGDGNTGSGKNIQHKYLAPGRYTVTLTASSPVFGVHTTTKTNYVLVSVPVPVPMFSVVPIIGFGPLTVTFTNESTGFPVSYLWNFGDGYTSVEKSPTHTYSFEGTYPVTLTVYNQAAPKGVISSLTNITVFPVPNLVSDYTTGSIVPEAGGLKVQFTDASIEALTWSWDFGDPESGSFNISNDRNPSHVYSSVGIYTVTLTVTNGPFSESVSKDVLVTTDVLRYMEVWGTVRFVDGTQVAADKVVSVGKDSTSTYTDTSRSYKTVDDAGVTRFLVRGRGNVLGLPDSGFDDGAPVYLFIGGRQATVQSQSGMAPWSSPFFMTLPSNEIENKEVEIVLPLVATTIHPEPGIYEDRTEIIFTSNVEPLIVYYTLDGTDPKTSITRQLYIVPFYVEEGTTTIKYYSEDTLGADEITREATYIVNGPFVYSNYESGDYSTPLTVELTGNRAGVIYYRLNQVGDYAIYHDSIFIDAGATGVSTTIIETYLVDEHSEEGSVQQLEYKIDLLNPVIELCTLSNGDSITAQQMITVQVVASSYTNTVTGLLLSVYPDFHDTFVRLYEPEVVFKLPAPDGVKTVYVQVVDQIGHMSSVKSQSIQLNTEDPVFTVSASPSEPIGEMSYMFTGTKSAHSGIYLTLNDEEEVLIVPFDANTTWQYKVTLTEGINVLQLQAGTEVMNRSEIQMRTVDVRSIPQGAIKATTTTDDEGNWRIPFVFFNEETGEEATNDLKPPLKQHHNIKKRHHDFRLIVTSDVNPSDPEWEPVVVTFPTKNSVLTEKVITVTGTAKPGSKITLTVQKRGKMPA